MVYSEECTLTGASNRSVKSRLAVSFLISFDYWMRPLQVHFKDSGYKYNAVDKKKKGHETLDFLYMKVQEESGRKTECFPANKRDIL